LQKRGNFIDTIPFIAVASCEPSIRWEVLGIQGAGRALMPEETEAVNRTFIFAIVYLGLHAALLFTALCSLCGINNSCLGRRSFGIFFAPWIIALVAIIVLDVMGVVFYSIDALNATVSSKFDKMVTKNYSCGSECISLKIFTYHLSESRKYRKK
jgi:hypothetical protein